MHAKGLRSELSDESGSASKGAQQPGAVATSSRAKGPQWGANSAMSRWLSESTHESPWTAVHVHTKSARARNSDVIGDLDEIVTNIQFAKPNGYRRSEPFSLLLSNSSTRGIENLNGLLDGRSLVEQDLQAGSKTLKSADARNPEKASRQTVQDPLTMRQAATATKNDGIPIIQPKSLSISCRRSTLCSSSGGSTEGLSGTTKAPELHRRPEYLPPNVSSCGDATHPSPQNNQAEGLGVAACSDEHSQQQSFPHIHRIPSLSLSKDTQTPPQTDNEDLKSHANVFIALLAAYGFCTRGNGESGSGKEPNTPPEGRKDTFDGSRSNNTHQTNNNRGATSKRDADPGSGDEPIPPGKRQKRPPRQGSSERRWSCQYAKLDGVTYHHCVRWSCERIESVERHLRSKHALSPAIEHKIKKLPPFKRPEDRWQAYYCKLFGIPREHVDLVPSPYFEDITLATTATAVPEFDSPLPAEWWTTTPRNEVQFEQPINPHASTYASEALQLSERYEVRLGNLRLRAGQAQAQLQAIEEERKQLKAELEQDFGRMFTRFRQNQPPEDRQIDPIPLIPDMQPPTNTNWHVTPPFEIPGPVGEEAQQRSFGSGLPPQPTQASLHDDSGYGTLSDDTLCTCHESSCYKCEVFDLLRMPEGELPLNDG